MANKRTIGRLLNVRSIVPDWRDESGQFVRVQQNDQDVPGADISYLI